MVLQDSVLHTAQQRSVCTPPSAQLQLIKKSVTVGRISTVEQVAIDEGISVGFDVASKLLSQ